LDHLRVSNVYCFWIFQLVIYHHIVHVIERN
jgi:hypothetical protein